jgi:hypothetical protein
MGRSLQSGKQIRAIDLKEEKGRAIFIDAPETSILGSIF